MDRFDDRQARDYWKTQRRRAGETNPAEDPDFLGNVCHAGAPLWLNQYYARHQRAVFEQLLSECPAPKAGSRALDIGCGGGRWCALLAEHGYTVQGIDLQDHLVAADRARYPHITFECVSIQDFRPSAPFDLVSTVTVLQHIPFDDQKVAAAKIASMVNPGGHLLILENIHDQGIHVFSRSIHDWQSLFEAQGFRSLSVHRYDYSPTLRAMSSLMGGAANLARRAGLLPTPSGPNVPSVVSDDPSNGGGAGARLRGSLRSVGWFVRRAAIEIDDKVEPLLVRRNMKMSTVHCGFLFEKPKS
jgi:2-polyprenyl-3-methyl-5-hydroxy-6-metoxy-1,4-benzoquinol methylase